MDYQKIREEIQNGRFGNNYTFVQNNNSPKALSRIDIYRDTRNVLKTLCADYPIEKK